MKPWEEIEIAIPGLTLRGLAWGPSDGAPLLALHGWLDNAASFCRLAPLLSEHRVVALDLPGHGRSDHRAQSASYHFIDWVPDVVAAAEALEWDTFSILGHSMGAGIATLLAGTFPERVLRLGLIEGFGPLSEGPEGVPARLARHVIQRGFDGEPRVMDDHSEAVGRVLRGASGLLPDSAEVLVTRGTRELPGGGVEWAWDPRLRLASAIRLTEEQVLAFLSRITAPVLVVRARQGFPFDEVVLEARKGAVRHLEVLEVEGGHHVHLDHPEQLIEALRAHLVGR